jgi:hypothetical protein
LDEVKNIFHLIQPVWFYSIMENNKKEITIEELAGMVKRGFDRNDKGFTEMAADIKKLSKDVTDINYKVTQIDKRLFTLEEDIYVTKKKEFEKLEGRVSLVERKLKIA